MADREKVIETIEDYVSRQNYRFAKLEDAGVLKMLWGYVRKKDEQQKESGSAYTFLEDDLQFIVDVSLSRSTEDTSIVIKFANSPINYTHYKTIRIPVADLLC